MNDKEKLNQFIDKLSEKIDTVLDNAQDICNETDQVKLILSSLYNYYNNIVNLIKIRYPILKNLYFDLPTVIPVDDIPAIDIGLQFLPVDVIPASDIGLQFLESENCIKCYQIQYYVGNLVAHKTLNTIFYVNENKFVEEADNNHPRLVDMYYKEQKYLDMKSNLSCMNIDKFIKKIESYFLENIEGILTSEMSKQSNLDIFRHS